MMMRAKARVHEFSPLSRSDGYRLWDSDSRIILTGNRAVVVEFDRLKVS
jgi:hypothetical protein